MKILLLLITSTILSTCSNSKKMDISSLFDKKMNVVSLNEEDVSALDLTVTLQNENNSINGFAGCNNYFGNYSIEGTAVTFSKIGATKKYCGDSNINNTEKSFLNALANVTSYNSASSDNVNLLNKAGEVIITLKF